MNTSTKITWKFWSISILILTLTFSRAIPHMPNFSPLGALCLFGAAYYSKKWQALLIPILFVWISDLWINNVLYFQYFEKFTWFYPGFYWQYISYILICVLGFFLFKKIKIQNILIGSFACSFLFFTISNFGVWYSSKLYPPTIDGLIMCYIAGIPYLKGTLMGDLFYSFVLFGAFEYFQQKVFLFQKS